VIYTIGHGNRSIEEFLGLLKDAAIECLVDVRAYPASRRHPQFARASLEISLAGAGIRYVWEGTALGGRRKPEPDSPHIALGNPGFRAYADHMTTQEFRDALARLIGLGRAAPAAVMCAERLPWECHRFLISDSMMASGQGVIHLINPGSRREHALSAIARMRGGDLVYDGAAQRKLGL
jgi:uncharacterized protein (DUF488 family)